MERMKNGLCLELISHPGETLAEYLEERSMSQEELAFRTNFSKKHISEVVNGKKGISTDFAKGLEYALGVPMSFWLNLQSIYDEEMLVYHEQNNISVDELALIKQLKGIIKVGEKYGVLAPNLGKDERLFELRNICGVTNLLSIPQVLSIQRRAYRKSKSTEIDPTILYLWLTISEKHVATSELKHSYSKEELIKRLGQIKKCMFLDHKSAVIKLQTIFEECGIIFHVMDYVKGAPVQGYIKKQDEKVILTITTRRKFADEFWFTLFHEIGHILNDDLTKDVHIDFDNDEVMESKADKFATNELIDSEAFREFLGKGDYSEAAVIKFAKSQNVMPFVVAGRLQKHFNNYKLWNKLKVTYQWE